MFELKVDGFQGPLDLLLDLIEKEQMDITTLSLAQVTDQYWSYVKSQRQMEPDALAEFIVIGSKLLFIKSCALLPHAAPPRGDLREEEDVGAQLAQMLEQYKQFKEAAFVFRELEEQGRRAYSRVGPPKNVTLPPGLEGVTLNTLLDAVREAMARKPEEPEQGVIEPEPVTVDLKIEEIGRALTENEGRLRFRPLLAACRTRTEIVVLFLAVLELIKAGRLWARQNKLFGEIELVETAAEPA
ncbi:MAG: segregation/condensation protein A [Chloroflexi bacterium]|nr:segregation/condensation protein A [Chloroflexota bacterium]